MFGKGKYDPELTAVRESTQAAGAILIIIEGNQGSGFSAQLPPELTAKMPDLLRIVATAIERDYQKLEAQLDKLGEQPDP